MNIETFKVVLYHDIFKNAYPQYFDYYKTLLCEYGLSKENINNTVTKQMRYDPIFIQAVEYVNKYLNNEFDEYTTLLIEKIPVIAKSHYSIKRCEDDGYEYIHYKLGQFVRT